MSGLVRTMPGEMKQQLRSLGWRLEAENQWYTIWVLPNGNKKVIHHPEED